MQLTHTSPESTPQYLVYVVKYTTCLSQRKSCSAQVGFTYGLSSSEWSDVISSLIMVWCRALDFHMLGYHSFMANYRQDLSTSTWALRCIFIFECVVMDCVCVYVRARGCVHVDACVIVGMSVCVRARVYVNTILISCISYLNLQDR